MNLKNIQATHESPCSVWFYLLIYLVVLGLTWGLLHAKHMLYYWVASPTFCSLQVGPCYAVQAGLNMYPRLFSNLPYRTIAYPGLGLWMSTVTLPWSTVWIQVPSRSPVSLPSTYHAVNSMVSVQCQCTAAVSQVLALASCLSSWRQGRLWSGPL